MLSRRELLEVLANLSAPLTPFTLEGSPDEDMLFIDWLEQRSREQLEPLLEDAVEAFIDLLTRPPAPSEYVPPARDESSFKTELFGMAELYGQTSRAPAIIQGLEPVLRQSSQRLWAIEALGRMRHPAALARLHALAASSLSHEEAQCLAEALAEGDG
jgi:hypothetical protein